MSASTPKPRSSGGQKGARKGTQKKTKKKAPKQKLTAKQWMMRLLKIGLVAALVGTLVLGGVVVFAYRATKIPDPNEAYQAQTTKVYYAGGKSQIGRFADQNRESIPLADIPQVMQDAVVAAEDRTFWTNKGIDPKGILRAAFSNAKGGSTQGASTITQQYVKILYLTQERTLSRKVKEAFLSLKLQNQKSKSEILEGYLNTIFFGRNAYGVQAAANAYFGIPAKDLNASQAAMLAAVLNSPNYLSPDRNEAARAALLARYQYVVNSMEASGKLSSSEAAKISGKLPDLKAPATNNQYGGQKGFMLDMVKAELLKLGFDDSQISGGGLRVTTTFTRKAMDAAKNAVLEQRPAGFSDKELHVGVSSVDVKTGALLGFYGGQNYLQSQLNWATAKDSPGSAFKPFAAAAAIKDGFSLKDTFDGNSPYEFPDGTEVKNEGGGNGNDYGAKVSMVKAMEESINTAFMDMTMSMENGPQKIRDMAVALGIPDRPSLEDNVGISLGSAPQSPLEMANAYATIANGGLHHNTYVIAKVTDASSGEVLYTAPKKTDRVLDEDIAADVSYAMQQVVQHGTGANAQRIGRPAAGKTGTATNDNGDVITSWFVGYTPQIATAVMYVRGNGRGRLDGWLPSYFGATYPTQTWAAAMSALLDGVDREDFPPPANVDGEAPDKGHDPAPPKPTKKPSKKPTPTVVPTTAAPTPTPTPTPTEVPTPTATPTVPPPTNTCGPLHTEPCP